MLSLSDRLYSTQLQLSKSVGELVSCGSVQPVHSCWLEKS